MKSMTRALLAALLVAAVPATYVIAQGGPGGRAAGEPGMEGQRGGWHRGGASPEMRGRMLDGRIAMMREALKLSPEQAKLFEPVEAKIRANAAERSAKQEERRAERRERRAEGGARGERPGLPDRLERMSANLAERAQKTREMAETLKPFYASLSPEQRQVADELVGHGGGKGKRWAHRGGPGRHEGGWGRHDRGDRMDGPGADDGAGRERR